MKITQKRLIEIINEEIQAAQELEEISQKPDFLDLNNNGDTDESMEDAAKDLEESYSVDAEIDEGH